MQTFAEFCLLHGLLAADPVPDGRVHRCPTELHPRSRNGAYRFFGDWGWLQAWDAHAETIIWQARGGDDSPVPIPKRDLAQLRQAEERRYADAAAKAQEITRRCRTDVHPYLARKGFPNEAGLIDHDGRLVIPMRDCRDYKRINSVQWIDDHGSKLFLPGGRAGCSMHVIGSGVEKWLCEGYATGLSLRAALRHLHRAASVVVCFSAGNLAHVATQIGGKRFVFADHDKSGTGQRAAESTGLPWVMPPDEGHDANDIHQAHGVRPLAELMRRLL